MFVCVCVRVCACVCGVCVHACGHVEIHHLKFSSYVLCTYVLYYACIILYNVMYK